MIFSFNAFATFNVYEFNNDTIKEEQFRSLIADLRCPKCQNNNLADSNAPLATDIKNYVYKSIKSGKTDEEITDFLISRYGLFIIYDPKIVWLWLVPLLAALGGLFVIKKHMKKEKKNNQPVMEDTVTMETLIAEYEKSKEE